MKSFIKSITTKYIIIGLFIIGLVASFTALSFWFTNRVKDDARRINLAGKGRMLNYEMAWLLNPTPPHKAIVGQDEKKTEHLNYLKEEMTYFEEILYALRDGSRKYKLGPLSQGNYITMLHRKMALGGLDSIIEKWRSKIRPTLIKAVEGDPGAFRQYNIMIHGYVDEIDSFVNYLEQNYKKEFIFYNRLHLVAIALSALVFISLIVFTRKTLVKPILRLKDAAGEIERGNLDVSVKTETVDEIGELGDAFNNMARERKEAEEALRNIAEGVSAETGEKFFYSLVMYLAGTLKADYCFIAELAGKKDKNVRTIAVFADGKTVDNFEYSLVNTPCENIIAKKICSYPHSVRQQFPEDPRLAENQIESYIGTPLIDSTERILGILVVLDRKPMRNEELAKSLLKIFAVRASAEMERRQTEAKLKRHSKEVLALADSSNVIGAISITENVYEAICNIAVRNFGFKIVWIGLMEDGSYDIKPVAQSGFKGEFLSATKTATDVAIKTTGAEVINDIAADPRHSILSEEAKKLGCNSLMVMPLISSEAKIIGMLNLYSSEAHFFTKDRIKLFYVFANHAASAIENRLLIEGLENRVKERTAEIEKVNYELKKLFNAVEQAAEVIIITDTHGIIQYVNPAFSAISGYSKEEAIGKTPRILSSGKNPPELFKNLWETILSGRIWSGTVINRKKTGELYYEEMTVAPVMNDHGEIINFIAIKNDVTDRVKVEEELKQKTVELKKYGFRLHKLYEISLATRANAKEFARMILSEIAEMLDVDAAGVGSISEGEWVAYAVADRKDFGIKEGMRFPLNEVYCGIVSETKKPLVINDATVSAEFENHPDLLKYGTVSYLGVPVFIRDELFGTLCTFSKSPHNYTEYDLILHHLLRKRLEFEFIKERYEDDLRAAMMTAETASKAKSEFLANMSHELRTPLNSIIGFSEVMMDGMTGTVTDEQKEFLNDIFVSGKHLLDLINDILDLSKIEAGKMELELSEFNLEGLIEGSLMLFKEKTLKHNIKVKAEVEQGIDEIIADERKIKQIIFNLLSNAVKFTPDGGLVRVTARKIEAEKNRDFIEISVEDTGIGISPEDRKWLFQPFKQLETTLSKKQTGTGLGLSLSKSFVELHKGRIWVESEPGKGSTFTFTVPLLKEMIIG